MKHYKSLGKKMDQFHGTTIVSVRGESAVAIGGDGQVTMGQTVIKSGARKVRRIGNDSVLAGFAGAFATLPARFVRTSDETGLTEANCAALRQLLLARPDGGDGGAASAPRVADGDRVVLRVHFYGFRLLHVLFNESERHQPLNLSVVDARRVQQEVVLR